RAGTPPHGRGHRPRAARRRRELSRVEAGHNGYGRAAPLAALRAAAMWQVHCFPLCPFSRKVRLALAEKGVPFELLRANPWDASDAFYALNPAGRTPVLHDDARRVTL